MNNATLFFLNISKLDFFDAISNSFPVYHNEMKQLVSVLVGKYNLKKPWEVDAIDSAIASNFEYFLYYIKINQNRYFVCCDFFNSDNINLYSKLYSDKDSTYYILSFVETDENKIELSIYSNSSLKATIFVESSIHNVLKLKYKNIKEFESLFDVTRNDIKACVNGKNINEG